MDRQVCTLTSAHLSKIDTVYEFRDLDYRNGINTVWLIGHLCLHSSSVSQRSRWCLRGKFLSLYLLCHIYWEERKKGTLIFYVITKYGVCIGQRSRSQCEVEGGSVLCAWPITVYSSNFCETQCPGWLKGLQRVLYQQIWLVVVMLVAVCIHC